MESQSAGVLIEQPREHRIRLNPGDRGRLDKLECIVAPKPKAVAVVAFRVFEPLRIGQCNTSENFAGVNPRKGPHFD
jgi:hypothetical protein